MASAYPGAVDALVRPDGTDPLSDGHAALHNATSDAVEAVQTELGVNPSGSALTVAARFTAAESATTDAQADATTALADAATADGKAVAAQADATTGIGDAATAQATANAAVPKATYDAHTVLAATTDNTPAAVTVGEQTIVGRKTGGNITALTAAETKTLLAIAEGDVTNLTSDLSAKAPLASPTFTGVPAAPTAAVDTATTQVATTAFTVAQIADDAVAKSAVGNLLTANLASGTDTLADTTGFALAGSCTITSSTAEAWQGSRSLKAAVTGAEVAGVNIGAVGDLASMAPVTAGQTYTLSAYVRPSANAPVTYQIYWRTSDGSAVSATSGAAVTAASGAWTRVLVTGVAPATAAYAILEVYVVTPAAGHVYIDGLGFWEGAGGQWALPGTPITNLGYYTDESVGRRLFQWDANNSRWQQTFGDTGWRDVTGSIAAGLAATNPTLTLYVRRHGIRVSWLLFEGAAGTATGLVNILAAVPAGFNQTPTVSTYAAYPLMNYATGTITLESVYMSSFDMNTAGWTTIRHTGSWSYTTTDAWPTALPGTASGSIPA